jgi:hypothetical protein
MLKIFLMTKNEPELLENWILYHSYIFGLDNIYVLDGSDDSRALRVFEKFQPRGLTVRFSSAGLNELAGELTEMMHLYKGTDNFLIKMDTDEFLAYTPDPNSIIKYEGTHAAIRESSYCKLKNWLLSAGGLARPTNNKLQITNFKDFFERLPVTGQSYKASFTCWSKPKTQSVKDICEEITVFSPLHMTDFKSFFHSSSFVSVDLGCHAGVSTNNSGVIQTGLCIIHFHSTSVEDSARRARQVLLSHGYISEHDSSKEQVLQLQRLRLRGEIASFHKIDFYLQYLDATKRGEKLNPETLNHYHPHFKQIGPTSTLNLVRDTLRFISSR